jgi:iron(III) transport system substrate-binding protein
MGKRHPMLPSPSSLVSAALLILWVAGGAAAQSYEEPHQRLVDSAVQESAVTVLSTTDLAEVQDLLAGFRARYPGIRLDYEKGNSTAIYERVRGESDADAGTVDLVWSSAMDLQLKLVNDGYAQRYEAQALHALPDWAVWKNEAYGVTAEPIAIIYNKRLLSPAEAPSSHADLIHLLGDKAEAMPGRIATYDPERSSVGYLLLTQDVLVTDRTWSLIHAMALAGVRLYASSDEMIDSVARGDAVLAYNVIGSYALDRAHNAPALGVVLPADYTLVMSRVALIPRGAPHPSTARLFLDHLLSAAGQRALAAHAIGPVRGDALRGGMSLPLQEAARPIQLGLRLLAGLDEAKHAQFIRDWRTLLGNKPSP